MKASRRGTALRRLLDLCDDLQRIRTKLTDPALRRDARTRLRRQARNKTDQLANDLASYRFKGPLGQVMREFKFEPVHFQVLATLLHRHIRSESPAMEGRAILAAIFDNSFEVLSGLELLHENGVLRASGLVVLEDDEECPDDALEASFRISEDALITFQQEIAGLVIEDQRNNRTTAYGNNRELLVDLRILSNLYRHRSERVFQQERWDRIHAGSIVPGSYLTRRIENFWSRVEKRIEASVDAEDFPVVRFYREYDLDRNELVILVHMLFRELYEGNAYADSAELIRIVSADEIELIRNRRLMLGTSTLVREDILKIEPMLENRELTGEVYLSDWVVNYLFGAIPREEAIDGDDRLNWHLYLKNLEDTGSFFRDLEAN